MRRRTQHGAMTQAGRDAFPTDYEKVRVHMSQQNNQKVGGLSLGTAVV